MQLIKWDTYFDDVLNNWDHHGEYKNDKFYIGKFNDINGRTIDKWHCYINGKLVLISSLPKKKIKKVLEFLYFSRYADYNTYVGALCEWPDLHNRVVRKAISTTPGNEDPLEAKPN